jgi:hypothetical protein
MKLWLLGFYVKNVRVYPFLGGCWHDCSAVSGREYGASRVHYHHFSASRIQPVLPLTKKVSKK